MGLIDFILNLAAVLLWLNWRSIQLDPLTRATPATLVGTVRRAEPSRLKRWHFLVFLAALVFLRAAFYWKIGPAAGWTPKLDLAAVTLAFPANRFPAALLFSVLSFLRALLIFYFWLLTLAVINGPATGSDPLHKLLVLQLGRTARWPRWLQASAPCLAAAALWILFHPLLAHAGIVSWTRSWLPLAGQGALVGAGLYSSLKYVLPAFLFIHLVSSYVYLGTSRLGDFISYTARNILVPFHRLPLRLGRIDLAPLAGIALILLVLHTLPALIRSWMIHRGWPLWPH